MHFAVDLTNVYMTTKLEGAHTYFLPFNQGSNGAGKVGGKGNPVNPDGYDTAYLWERVLCKDSLMEVLQKYMHLQQEYDKGGNLVKETMIFPRYHQLYVVTKLLEDVKKNGSGKSYLIQHSAGSGKSNSIAWLAHRLTGLHDYEDTDKWVFDWGNKKHCYHIDFPEFQIVQMEDMQQGWVPAAAFYAHPVMHLARLNVMYHNTTIYESVLWSFDEFRKYLPEARNSGVKNKMDFWYSYYLLDSIEGKMLKIFTHRSCDISSREPNYHQILIFENEDQKKEFDMYVFEHFDDHSDEEINDKYKYQIQEDKKENLGGLKFSAYQVAKIAWLYEDWRS